LPPTMQTVGERAFYGAKSLNTLVFQGPIAVGKEAFAECAGLENMVIANGQFKVGEAAFANCNSIQEITFNSNGDTPAGTADVFSEEAYANTALYSTYDTNIRWVDFNNLPWSKFFHRPFRRSNDYIGEEKPSGIYEHASIPHTVSKGQVEVMYFPFQWDSYYFGANAEVYVMHNNDFDFNSTSNRLDDILTTEGKKLDQTAYDTKMRRVDLLAHKLLPAGVYAVKTDFPATELHSMSNLYVANGVEVNNTTHWEKSGKVELIFGGISGDTEPDGYGGDYVFEDGVLKLMNGKSVLQNGAVVISAIDNDANHFVLNISNEADELLLTSRTPVPFHGALEGYATFYNEKFNVKAPSWCTVYVVTSAAGGSVHLEEITDRVIDAGQAVILKTKNPKAIGAEDLVTYAKNGSERGAALYKQNLLKGVAVDTPVADLCGNADHIYVLSCNASLTNTGFYKYSTGKTLGAGKAYLPSTASSAEAKNCLFSLSDLETSIHHAADRSASQQMYDLSGRRVVNRSADQKGIFIINNQKIVK
ncbi:MAG: leucine-rich repeat protein, partial [Bacteroidaceae bacterium]|nr:leucine-rich repeat protein [Bacteroidaceae bacterium]